MERDRQRRRVWCAIPLSVANAHIIIIASTNTNVLVLDRTRPCACVGDFDRTRLYSRIAAIPVHSERYAIRLSSALLLLLLLLCSPLSAAADLCASHRCDRFRF